MPDERSPQPSELSAPAPSKPVGQPERQRQSGPSQDSAVNVEQTNPTPSASAPISVPPLDPPDESQQRIPHWLQQAERFLRVIVRMYLGLLVCCAPWYSPAWDNNPLFMSSPNLLAFVTHGAVRGVVSGLGILNLWIAARDALRSTSTPGSR